MTNAAASSLLLIQPQFYMLTTLSLKKKKELPTYIAQFAIW